MGPTNGPTKAQLMIPINGIVLHQTRKTTAISCIVVGKTGVSGHHGVPIEGPLKLLRPSPHYFNEGFNGVLKWVPHCAEKIPRTMDIILFKSGCPRNRSIQKLYGVAVESFSISIHKSHKNQCHQY